MKLKISLFLFLVLAISAGLDQQPPDTSISNGLINAKIYLPDAFNGYYRGSRFDWSGVIYHLEYNGHTYFGKWFDRYEPTLHDAIMGPVDSFNPIGYDEARIGQGFLRIGVGILEKPDEPRYAFTTPYKILDHGNWKIKRNSSSVTFIQELKSDKYQYKYTKTVQLTKGKPEILLRHTLENKGSDELETDVYNHNFFVIDNQPTGPDFIVKFPFVPQGELKGKTDKGSIEGQNIVYHDVIQKGEYFAVSPLTGYASTMADHDFRIENKRTMAGVRIIGDKPIVKFVYWSAAATLCPEPYINVKVQPGGSMNWSIRYELYTNGR